MKKGFSTPLLLLLFLPIAILLFFLYNHFTYQSDEQYLYSFAKKLGYNQNSHISITHKFATAYDLINLKFKTDKDFDNFFTLINNLHFTIFQYYGWGEWIIWDQGRYLGVEYSDDNEVEISLDRETNPPKQEPNDEEMPLAWERYTNETFGYSIKFSRGSGLPNKAITRIFPPEDVYGLHILVADNPQNLSLEDWFQSDEAKKLEIVFDWKTGFIGIGDTKERTWINVDKYNILTTYLLPAYKIIWANLNRDRIVFVIVPKEDWEKSSYKKYGIYYMLKTFKYL